MKRMLLAAIFMTVVFSLAFIFSCGDDDDDDDDGGGGSVSCDGDEACEACKTMLEVMCEKMLECTDEVSMSECLDVASDVADCHDVIGVLDEFDECIDEMEAMDCSDMMDGDLPEVCEGVLLVA